MKKHILYIIGIIAFISFAACTKSNKERVENIDVNEIFYNAKQEFRTSFYQIQTEYSELANKGLSNSEIWNILNDGIRERSQLGDSFLQTKSSYADAPYISEYVNLIISNQGNEMLTACKIASDKVLDLNEKKTLIRAAGWISELSEHGLLETINIGTKSLEIEPKKYEEALKRCTEDKNIDVAMALTVAVIGIVAAPVAAPAILTAYVADIAFIMYKFKVCVERAEKDYNTK